MERNKVIRMILAVGLIICGVIGGYAIASQPHMEAALASLQNASAQMEMATHNKGGHRVEALKLTNLAIVEVKRGIEVGEYHINSWGKINY